jgi:hypothetical protein
MTKLNLAAATPCQVFMEDALSLSLPPSLIPACQVPEGMTLIDSPTRRMTLISKRGMRKIKHLFNGVDLAALNPPTPIFGPARIVVRESNDTRVEMACVVCPVENQAQITAFVLDLLGSLGIPSPEKRFLHHLTLANNAGGHPRGSIAYLNPSDFQGPPQHQDRVFKTRPAPEGYDLPDLSEAPARRPPGP